MGAWIDRTIKAEAGVPLRETAEPLVTAFLKSARNPARHKAEPFLPDRPQRDIQQPRFPRTSPAIAAASRGAESGGGRAGMVRGVASAVVLIALLIGGYWLVAKFPKGGDVMFAGSGQLDDGASRATAKAGGEAAPGASAPLTPVQTLTDAANKGDARARHDLGLMYVQGNGVPKDPAKGAVLLEQSAATGLPKAQYHVGVLYEQGLGVPRNPQTAFRWYQRAADQGHVRAQHNLGTFYAEGKGTARNYTEAARWFSRASQGGLAESHYSLGMIHELGLGVRKDDRKAASYYRSALAAGSAEAAAKLAQIEPAIRELSKQADEALAARVATTENEPAAAAAKGRALSASGIVNLQRLLARLDLSPGPPNGVLGEQTVEAIKLYQRFAGLPVDGKPSIELLRDLRQVVGAMETDKAGAAAPARTR